MIPTKPLIIKSPICYKGDTRNIPESTPLGSNQLSFESGFPVITSTPLNAGGLPPDRLDFNAALNLLSTFIYYMQSGNQFAWNSQLDYNIGAFVMGSDNAVYYCIQANGATSPNTVQNPTSSTDYWVKIINTDGKFNIDNLSKTLGAFAFLDNINLTDNTITGILSELKGGTGNMVGRATSIESILGSNFIQKIGLAYGSYTTAEFCNALTQDSIYFSSGQIIVTWIYKSGQALDDIYITDLPYDICCLEIKKFDTFRLTLTAYNPVTYDRAIGIYTSSSQFQGWKKLIDYQGKLVDNIVNSNAIQNGAVTNEKVTSVAATKVTGLAKVATSGSYNDLSNKPNGSYMPLPQTDVSSNNLGYVYYGAINNGPAILPAGGTWIWWGIASDTSNQARLTYMQGPFGVSAGGSNIFVKLDKCFIRTMAIRIQ